MNKLRVLARARILNLLDLWKQVKYFGFTPQAERKYASQARVRVWHGDYLDAEQARKDAENYQVEWVHRSSLLLRNEESSATKSLMGKWHDEMKKALPTAPLDSPSGPSDEKRLKTFFSNLERQIVELYVNKKDDKNVIKRFEKVIGDVINFSYNNKEKVAARKLFQNPTEELKQLMASDKKDSCEFAKAFGLQYKPDPDVTDRSGRSGKVNHPFICDYLEYGGPVKCVKPVINGMCTGQRPPTEAEIASAKKAAESKKKASVKKAIKPKKKAAAKKPKKKASAKKAIKPER